MTKPPLLEYCERCGRQLLERVVPTGRYSRETGGAQSETMHLCPQRDRRLSLFADMHDIHRSWSGGCVEYAPRPVSPKPPSRPNPSKSEERGDPWKPQERGR